ncbi:hypothetical protein KUTeg_022575 [Tegillarca granosa]|uniref:Tyr recombinase domain-containing protein n=1 Tax=Tegillarca granosa TaxID=220873 RepID=A0ABQ9E6K8_TEGGR|nr:hypothetical protein KUTeg_022575 [Tegillarca granosa]
MCCCSFLISHKKGLSPSTVSSYLAAIFHVHKVCNWTNTTSQFLVQKAVTGLRRIRQVRDSRAPVTEDMLYNIYNISETVCWSEYKLWLLRSAYCLAFYGLLMVSELVYTTADMAYRPLFHSDIRVSTSGSNVGLLVKIRFSKTEQQGRSNNRKVSLPIRNRSDGKLFIHEDGSPLTRYHFNAVLKKSIIKLGIPVSVFSSHSFRIGATTTLALKGLDPSMIQGLGRWRSDAFSKYIRLDKLHFFVDVWISGSSIIYWACRMANRLLSRHLRLKHLGVHISWFGKRGMIWEGVLLTVSHKLTYLPPPKVLILHVGANNIRSTNTGNIYPPARNLDDRLLFHLVRSYVSPKLARSHSSRLSVVVVNYFVKALLRLDPRGRNLAVDASWEVQGQNFSSNKKATQTQLDTTMDIKPLSVFKYHYLCLNIHVCQSHPSILWACIQPLNPLGLGSGYTKNGGSTFPSALAQYITVNRCFEDPPETRGISSEYTVFEGPITFPALLPIVKPVSSAFQMLLATATAGLPGFAFFFLPILHQLLCQTPAKVGSYRMEYRHGRILGGLGAKR